MAPFIGRYESAIMPARDISGLCYRYLGYSCDLKGTPFMT